MAVVTLTSAALTSRNTGVLANATNASAAVKVVCDQMAVTNGDSIASTFRLFRVNSDWIVTSASVFCTAITSAAADIGLYQTAANGGAVVDADFFVAAQTIATASPGINILGGNTATYGPANRAKRIWEVLGLTADPMREYDVVLTLTAAATATGTAGVTLSFAE